MAKVKIDTYGFAYVPVYIKPRTTQTMSPLIYKVDTGANCTTISREELAKYGFSREWIKDGTLLRDNARPTVASGISIDGQSIHEVEYARILGSVSKV